MKVHQRKSKEIPNSRSGTLVDDVTNDDPNDDNDLDVDSLWTGELTFFCFTSLQFFQWRSHSSLECHDVIEGRQHDICVQLIIKLCLFSEGLVILRSFSQTSEEIIISNYVVRDVEVFRV